MLYSSAAALLQLGGGAYRGDFGGHPDEGAHFVTGLMVRDYLAGEFPGHPMRYAETYYAHYPKVALGHYPPGFYALEGVWLMVFPVGRASALLLLAALSGAVGAIVFLAARHGSRSTGGGFVAGGLTVALPLTQSMAATVMSDLLLTLLAALAAFSFARYLRTEKWLDSLGFGVLASAAIMTKGSGLFLALVPPVAIVLTARYRLILRPSLWVAVVPVVVICAPWLYWSSKITAEGMVERSVVEHLKSAVPYFGVQFIRVFGLAVALPALVGCVSVLRPPAPSRDSLGVVAFAAPVCLVAFYSLVPAGLEPRYLLPMVPFVLLLALEGFRWAVDRCVPVRRPVVAWMAGAILVGLFVLETFAVPGSGFAGMRADVRRMIGHVRPSGDAAKFLISSDARGEGAFVSEVAILDAARPRHVVDRSSKVLSTSDWLGRGYKEAFESDEALRSFLEEASYDAILVDETIPELFLNPHHRRLSRVLPESPLYVRLPDEGTEAPHAPRGGRNALYVRAPRGP